MNNKEISLGHYTTAEEAAYAYDKYVLDNNLEHNINNIGELPSFIKEK